MTTSIVFSPFFLGVVAGHYPLLLFLLWWPNLSLSLGVLVVAGYYSEKKKKKERKLASLGTWLVFLVFLLGEVFLCGRTLLGGEEGGWWFLILVDRCPHNVRG